MDKRDIKNMQKESYIDRLREMVVHEQQYIKDIYEDSLETDKLLSEEKELDIDILTFIKELTDIQIKSLNFNNTFPSLFKKSEVSDKLKKLINKINDAEMRYEEFNAEIRNNKRNNAILATQVHERNIKELEKQIRDYAFNSNKQNIPDNNKLVNIDDILATLNSYVSESTNEDLIKQINDFKDDLIRKALANIKDTVKETNNEH
ncbi:MAG: hypothetical protein PHT44_04680 [Candidatus Portnoybacteria bacterium]|nr:hypothetical protein [Candidatus Portnoybacteria bacterium]